MKKLMEKWRRYIENARKTLCVYDFDHTLVHTSAVVRLKECGSPLPQNQYDKLIKSKGLFERNKYDFSDYDKICDPKPVEQVLESLKNDLETGQNCWILTARKNADPIREFLPSILEGKTVPVVSVNADDFPKPELSDPEKKSDWIRGKIVEGCSRIRFYEDSYENAKAVWGLKEQFPNVHIEVFMVSRDGEEDLVQSLEELEKYQQIQRKKHPKMKKKLIGMGGQPQGDVYTDKPDFKRSKSAPPGAGGT